MSTISFIRRHIFRLPFGKVFTTRELLLYGTRATVDQSVSRLIKRGVIVRLARGVFVREGSRIKEISVVDIAKAKAESFGKQFAAWGGNEAHELKLTSDTRPEHIYSVNASSSSFKLGSITVQLKKTCQRRLRFGDNQAGKALRALWHCGRGQVNRALVEKAMYMFMRNDREEVRTSLPWIPAWLGTFFLHSTLPHSAFKNYPPLREPA